MMSHATGQILKGEKIIGWFEYNGTADVVLPKVYNGNGGQPNVEESNEKLAGNCPIPRIRTTGPIPIWMLPRSKQSTA